MLFAAALLAFLMVYLLPGDATAVLLGKQWTPDRAEALRIELGLNDSVFAQFGRFIEGVVLHGDFGRSSATNQPVAEELASRLPATIELALAAMIIATIGGVLIGVWTAIKPRSWRDMLGLTGALAGVSVPIFLLGFLAIAAFSTGGWFDFSAAEHFGAGGEESFFPLPQSGRYSLNLYPLEEFVAQHPKATGFYLHDTLFVAESWAAFWDVLRHLILPALVLATVPMAIITRITRASVGEALMQDYIRTARAKGLSRRTIVFKHALRNASIPIVTTAGSQLGYLLGGAVLTETIFQWPGMGRYMVTAVENQDVRPLQACILIAATAFLCVNFLVDASYALLDPRVRRSGKVKAA